MPTPPPWWSDTQVAPRGGVEQRVEQRPVGHGVRAVAASPRSRGWARRPSRCRDGRGRSRTGAFSSPVATISLKARPSRWRSPEPDPADPRGQALELDLLARHVEPVVEVRVVGDQLLHLGVGLVDVLGIARERRPAERADAAAEQRADIGGHEAGKVEGVGRRPPPWPPGGCCCRNRRSARPPSGSRASRWTWTAIEARARPSTASGSLLALCVPLLERSSRPADSR